MDNMYNLCINITYNIIKNKYHIALVGITELLSDIF
jgi:hypothetical protein